MHGEQESLMDLSGLLYAGCIACICLVYPSHRSGKGLLYTLPDVGITGVRTRGDRRNGTVAWRDVGKRNVVRTTPAARSCSGLAVTDVRQLKPSQLPRAYDARDIKGARPMEPTGTVAVDYYIWHVSEF